MLKAYEAERFAIPKAEPRNVLRFLMDQRGLRQEDLADGAPQSRISEMLAGKRTISKEIAKCFAKRFKVHGDIFF